MRRIITRLAVGALALPLCLPLAAHAAGDGPDNNACSGTAMQAVNAFTSSISCTSNPSTTPANDDNGSYILTLTAAPAKPALLCTGSGATAINVGSLTGSVTGPEAGTVTGGFF